MVAIEFDLIIRFCVCKIITISSKFSVQFRRGKKQNLLVSPGKDLIFAGTIDGLESISKDLLGPVVQFQVLQ